MPLGQSVPPLPWQEGHRRFGERPTQGRYGSVWRHTVYGGVFKFQAVREELARELRFELGEDHAGVHQEESALFAFVVDDHGRLIDGTGGFLLLRLGSGPLWAATQGRSWRVGASPNLLNVAISRARRRLYVIGSYPEWRPAPNFGVFATTDTFPKYDFFA